MINELHERARALHEEAVDGDLYKKGICMGYYQCLNTLLNHDEGYGINLAKECNIDKDKLFRLV